MMFSYNATEAQLVNWLLDQNQEETGCLFPQSKGWHLKVRLFYPMGVEQGFLLVEAQGEEQRLFFLSLDSSTTKEQLFQLTPSKVRKRLGEEGEVIYFAAEKRALDLAEPFERSMESAALLVLYQDRLDFLQGSFVDSRLEFRLTKQNQDMDMIPQRLPALPTKDLYGVGIIRFYQALFHGLNLAWQQKKGFLPLDELAQAASPYWQLMSKGDKRLLLKEMQESFGHLEKRFFKDLLRLEEGRKGQLGLSLLGDLEEKKILQSVARAQGQALSWLRHEHRQMQLVEE